MDKILIEMLEKLNLTKIEAEVYLSALQSKSGSAYDISRNLKTRSSVYGTLLKLKRRGLITESVRKDKKVFLAKDIQALIEEKRSENDIIYKNILSLAPHLLYSKHTGIKIFKGEGELVHGLKYGITGAKIDEEKLLYCIYPSSSKMTISPKDTLYYNFNIELHKKKYKKIIFSDTKVRSEYTKLDNELGNTRHSFSHSLLTDLSKLAIGVEILEQEGMIKVIFYKENLILIIENKELADFCILYLNSLL